mgnify:CR=1 FL=1
MKSSPLAFFEHEKFGSLRVVRSDQGAQWFVAKDVCGCLGLDTSNLSKMLDEDELSTCPVQYTDQVRNLSVVSEPGLYSLILRSRKPEAKAFKRWVTHEVIPSIRKTGGYLMAKPDDTPEAILARAVLVAQDTIRRIEAERDDLAVQYRVQLAFGRDVPVVDLAEVAPLLHRPSGVDGSVRPEFGRAVVVDPQVDSRYHDRQRVEAAADQSGQRVSHQPAPVGLKSHPPRLPVLRNQDSVYKVLRHRRIPLPWLPCRDLRPETSWMAVSSQSSVPRGGRTGHDVYRNGISG